MMMDLFFKSYPVKSYECWRLLLLTVILDLMIVQLEYKEFRYASYYNLTCCFFPSLFDWA